MRASWYKLTKKSRRRLKFLRDFRLKTDYRKPASFGQTFAGSTVPYKTSSELLVLGEREREKLAKLIETYGLALSLVVIRLCLLQAVLNKLFLKFATWCLTNNSKENLATSQFESSFLS